jgi:pyrimidine-specific ribonucleoside hydrolase
MTATVHDVLFDMETSDPDDAFTLALLCPHPRTRLRAVTITPGSRAQVGVVRRILGLLGQQDVPVGVRTKDHPKECVSEFHFSYLGDVAPADADGEAHDVLAAALARFPDAVLLTGAAVHNGRLLLNQHPTAQIARWVGQGGFAGDSVVPPEHRLEKFAGRETCPTFNFNGDPKGALLLLESPRVRLRHLVSKNVCHGVAYDAELHERLAPHRDAHAGLALVCRAMEGYLEKHHDGKLFHDPLALCALIEPGAFTFREVEVYRSKGEWGSRLKDGTGTFISVAVDREAFVRTLIG